MSTEKKCHEKKYDQLTAKNEAVRLTRKDRFQKPKTGSALGQYKAYFCKECDAWHIRKEGPKQQSSKQENILCPESSFIPA
jgi:hypothetical protein